MREVIGLTYDRAAELLGVEPHCLRNLARGRRKGSSFKPAYRERRPYRYSERQMPGFWLVATLLRAKKRPVYIGGLLKRIEELFEGDLQASKLIDDDSVAAIVAAGPYSRAAVLPLEGGTGSPTLISYLSVKGGVSLEEYPSGQQLIQFGQGTSLEITRKANHTIVIREERSA